MVLLPENQLDQTLWDGALLKHSEAHFLQSWAWGEFMHTIGNQIWRLAVAKDGEIINQLFVTKLALGFGWSLLYAPKGNLINKNLSATDQQQSSRLLLDAVQTLTASQKIILFRIDPHIPPSDKIALSIYRTFGFLHGAKEIQPHHSLVLNISRPVETLLNQMKSKTRYNIRLAQKKEVVVQQSDDIQTFVRLTQTTSARDNFKAHSASYYLKQFAALHAAGMQDLWLAYVEKEPVAGILVNKFGHTATYVHGASSDEHRNLMAPHLLQFVAIRHYHQEGLTNYDFWGIHPNPNHPWAGITRFKLGFGGQETEYVGTLELPLHPFLYQLYKFVNRIKR